jgi:hypothetical protein
MAYTFTVTATNAAGTGPASAASNSVTPCLPLTNSCSSDGQCCNNICANTCFVAGTKILLANGRVKEIQNLKGTDILLGAKGSHNKVVHLVVMPRQDRKIYAFNGGRYFVTDNHCFMTRDGWKAINPRMAKMENPQLTIGQLKEGDELVTIKGRTPLNRIEFKIIKDSVVYNPKLDGSHEYYADGFLVHNKQLILKCEATCSAPWAPSGISATAGNGQAAVTFIAPVDGGCPITSYTVKSNPGSFTSTRLSTSQTVTGLTNGTSYTFQVYATNSAGSSPFSSASNAVTPYTVPGAPTIGTATAGSASASVTFTAPASNGGSAITSYTATSSPGSFTASGSASPLTVTGLTKGASYTFTVTATNAAGAGPASAASNAVTPFTCVFGSGTSGGQCRGYLTATGAGSWTVPSDWSSTNKIEVIGGGGGGAGGGNGGGGGGGAYSAISNLSLTAGNSVSYSIGVGGNSGHDVSTNGGDTWFNNATSLASCVTAGSSVCVGAQGGVASGNGGAAGSGVGTTTYSGGNWVVYDGGGGAAGPGGNGGTSTSYSVGGNGDPSGTGGGAGGSTANGGNGTTWDSTHGSGGGGSAIGDYTGGLYGGGSGGGPDYQQGTHTNAGGQGIIVITYTSH